ncbi:MAG: 16S rRNA (cytidine(1402)-2'-O)-methyltransferase [Pseudomonadota bacterium]
MNPIASPYDPSSPSVPTLAAGLYLVATPIGAARDITLRALDLLGTADVLVAEDTRSLRRLMDIHGIPRGARPLLSYHDHNGAKMRPQILQRIRSGQSVVFASEAGSPLIADPGYDLARAVIEANLPLIGAPGPSAAIAALTVAGLPTDRFLFAGFLPSTAGKRAKALTELARVPATLVIYESPNRAAALLKTASEVLGAERKAVLCRELTKKFEEVLRGTLEELSSSLVGRQLKGEVVILIDRGAGQEVSASDIAHELSEAMERLSVRDASEEIAVRFGLKRRDVYQQALALSRKD